MAKREECKMFNPTLLICPTVGRLVKADTDARVNCYEKGKTKFKVKDSRR